jgi:hypothetical protein
MKEEIKAQQKARVESVLNDLEAELDEGFLEEIVTVRKRLWKLRLLNDHERTWAMKFVQNTSLVSLAHSTRAPLLAISIREIGVMGDDGKPDMMPVREFFVKQWEEQIKDKKALVEQILNNANPYALQYWFAERMYEWLSKRPPEFVGELFDAYRKLEERREAAEEAMGKSSAEDGNSSQKLETSSSKSSDQTQTSSGAGNS